ncbi:hypothetical protein BDV06DRAFT_22887 [Aspergillus oleicola]
MAEYHQQISALIPEILSDSLNFGSWKNNTGSNTERILCDANPYSSSPILQNPEANFFMRNEEASHHVPTAITSPAQLDSMCEHERAEWLMDRIESLGFENFDALVTTYSSTTFPESSPIHIEQMLSRSRRLARVLSELFASSAQWPTRERQGFNEEVTKIAESVLTSEGSSAHDALERKLRSLISEDGFDLNVDMDMDRDRLTTLTKQQVGAMKDIVINELPKLWTFLVGVASANPTVRLKDRSNIALAVMLLLHFAGHVPKEQLVRMLLACL